MIESNPILSIEHDPGSPFNLSTPNYRSMKEVRKPEKKERKRNREYIVTVRLNLQEAIYLDELVKEYGGSQSELLREIILNTELVEE